MASAIALARALAHELRLQQKDPKKFVDFVISQLRQGGELARFDGELYLSYLRAQRKEAVRVILLSGALIL